MRIRDAFRDWRDPANIRRDFLKLVALAVIVGIGAAAFFGLGLFNVAASSGHWKITDLVLHTVMRRSVKFHALGIEIGGLDDPGLVQVGAGHFESGCAPCHGSPAAPRNAVARELTPPPPDLAHKVPSWRDRELFWIVRHGVKYTGMPAWPAHDREVDHGRLHDVEIRAMVAFLRELPGMDAARYERLALGPAAEKAEATARLEGMSEPLADLVTNCARCHGFDGRGRASSALPRLDMQRQEYLAAALAAYADGTRASGMMELQASGLTGDEVTALATYFAGRPAGPVEAGASFLPEGVVEAGRRIATQGLVRDRVPACDGCHSPEGADHKPGFPALAGQRREYLTWQLELWRAEKRGGGPYAHLMEEAARNLEDRHIAALSAYYSAQQPGR